MGILNALLGKIAVSASDLYEMSCREIDKLNQQIYIKYDKFTLAMSYKVNRKEFNYIPYLDEAKTSVYKISATIGLYGQDYNNRRNENHITDVDVIYFIYKTGNYTNICCQVETDYNYNENDIMLRIGLLIKGFGQYVVSDLNNTYKESGKGMLLSNIYTWRSTCNYHDSTLILNNVKPEAIFTNNIMIGSHLTCYMYQRVFCGVHELMARYPFAVL